MRRITFGHLRECIRKVLAEEQTKQLPKIQPNFQKLLKLKFRDVTTPKQRSQGTYAWEAPDGIVYSFHTLIVGPATRYRTFAPEEGEFTAIRYQAETSQQQLLWPSAKERAAATSGSIPGISFNDGVMLVIRQNDRFKQGRDQRQIKQRAREVNPAEAYVSKFKKDHPDGDIIDFGVFYVLKEQEKAANAELTRWMKNLNDDNHSHYRDRTLAMIDDIKFANEQRKEITLHHSEIVRKEMFEMFDDDSMTTLEDFELFAANMDKNSPARSFVFDVLRDAALALTAI